MQPSVWIPQTGGVDQICHLLAAFQQPGTDQGQALAHLERCRSFPDFNNYLAFIFSEGDTVSIEVRQSAGLLLKNNLKAQYGSSSVEFQTYIKAALLRALGSEHRQLRQAAGSSAVAVLAAEGSGGLAAWPELLAALVRALEEGNEAAREGALDTLAKVCEDAPQQLEAPLSGLEGTASSLLLPRLLALLAPAAPPEAQCSALGVLNLLAGGMPPALAAALDQYLAALFSLAYSQSPSVRKAVCTGLVQMLHLEPERLMPHMQDVIEYMLTSTQDDDESVALESCEFWSAFCEAHCNPAVLRPFLQRLVPVLLRNMVYGEHDEEVSEAEAADAVVGERETELKPFVYRGKAGSGCDVEGDDDSDFDEVSRWNLRKCSAAGLDALSRVYGQELLPVVTPTVQTRLQDPDWRARESAILALGAISEGCAPGLAPYLQELVSMLLPCLDDLRPLVRSISCWALSRYSQWIVACGSCGTAADSSGALQFDAVVGGLLRHVLDRNRRVQEAACSALATLEEEAGPQLLPRLKLILETLAAAVSAYGRKNLRILYDALSTLAEAAGSALAAEEHRLLLMPPLLRKWGSLADDDRELLPLLECFTALASAMGPAFEEYAAGLYARCMRIVSAHLAAVASGQAAGVEPERELLVCALDLVSGLAEALGSSMEALVAASPLHSMLVTCCKDVSGDVRQSAFALVGDLCKACPTHLAPVAGELITLAIQSLDASCLRPDAMSAANNACWALGELCIKSRGEQLAGYTQPIVERLVPILAAPAGSMPRSLIENSAITLGRVAWISPDQVAPHLEHFVWQWCNTLRGIRDDVEKEHAFLGLCRLLRLNPQGALHAFAKVAEAFASWRVVRCEGLANELVQVMHLYKASLQGLGQWEAYLARMEVPVRDKLVDMCQL